MRVLKTKKIYTPNYFPSHFFRQLKRVLGKIRWFLVKYKLSYQRVFKCNFTIWRARWKKTEYFMLFLYLYDFYLTKQYFVNFGTAYHIFLYQKKLPSVKKSLILESKTSDFYFVIFCQLVRHITPLTYIFLLYYLQVYYLFINKSYFSN